MKKKKLAIITATSVIALTAALGSAYAAFTSFTDIENSFAKEDIQALADKGIVNGVGEGKFDPKGNVTREQQAAIINRLLKQLEAKDAELAAKIAELEKKGAQTVYVPVSTPAPTPDLTVTNPTDFVVMQDLGLAPDIGGEGIDGYNVGFDIDHVTLPYDRIKSIKVELTDANGAVIASRTATGAQVAKLAADDETYGGTDGQLSAAFIARTEAASNDWWNSTPYDMSVPAGAQVTIVDDNGKIYKVSRTI